ncbi:MAG: alpha/beta fold hydrolase [Firmicutes bacterium]|nr:alpha/beta fold hydrolase [Bacillota bacterium]MBR6473610.1 alpha/beta fold hydrolase [Bacillota bacterium]
MLHEVSFKSFNERDMVQGWVYVPAAEPKGIVQLIHGFGEHSRRYFHMIVAFMDAGFIVAADDHVGHGKTAVENDCWGDWGDKGPHTMMEDEHTLTGIVKEMYPGLPYFMFGHSMGSFIARDYIAKYGDELDGVTLCGTCGAFASLPDTMAALQAAVDAGRGMDSDAEFTNMLFGFMFSRIDEPVVLGNEWICHSKWVQDDHAADPFDAFTKPVTNRTMLDFCKMMDFITGTEWAAKVPKDLPIYNIGGDQDPVGSWGEGVYQTSNWLAETGHNVKTMLYSGYRHEIHNYDDLKWDVEDGIVEFFMSCL